MARPLFRRGSQAGSVYMDCEEAFKLIDKNGDGVLSRIEVIQACRTDARVAKLLRLPQRIHQEDGSRDRFEEIFQMMDEDDSKEVDLQEFQKFWVTHVLPHLWVEVTATPDILREDGSDEEKDEGEGEGDGDGGGTPAREHALRGPDPSLAITTSPVGTDIEPVSSVEPASAVSRRCRAGALTGTWRARPRGMGFGTMCVCRPASSALDAGPLERRVKVVCQSVALV